MEILKFTYILSVESTSMYEEDTIDVDLVLGLNLEGSWHESHRIIHHNHLHEDFL
jgi:hypothetical protein